MSFKEHGILLYLSPQLYQAHLKCQVDKELGRSYAGLLALTEGFYRLGYLSKEDYELAMAKYSTKLAEAKPSVMCGAKGCDQPAMFKAYNRSTRKEVSLCEKHIGMYREWLEDAMEIKHK